MALSNAYTPTSYSFDKERTAVTGLKEFPENALLDLSLNYQTDNFKSFTTTLTDARSVPIAVTYQLSSLRKTSYKPRLSDDRVGSFLVIRQDFTSDHPQTRQMLSNAV